MFSLLSNENRKRKEKENRPSTETVGQSMQGSSDRRPFQTFSFTQKPCEKLPCQGDWFLAEVQALASFCSDFLCPALSQISTLKAFYVDAATSRQGDGLLLKRCLCCGQV
ncbi:hypothetical protein Q5P01_001906 [Channa striata]|uniref:Uncharacterized protein n=1 Tax=Channa striata TaxID=64152 RepID=A0AA88NZM5_CHASR|nr:hypothetical protein Q5P01_001906 [Channa striata]